MTEKSCNGENLSKIGREEYERNRWSNVSASHNIIHVVLPVQWRIPFTLPSPSRFPFHFFVLSSYPSVTFKPNPSESKYSLFLPPASCKICAMALAFSILFRSTYDRLFLMASPISSADRASPWARTTIACFSWRALSTTNAAR